MKFLSSTVTQPSMDMKFKLVEGYPAYRVSDSGVVQSRWRLGGNHKKSKGGEFTETWKTLTPFPDGKSYLQVTLCDGIRKGKTHRVHNLVTQVFIGLRPKGLVNRHLDGNPKNNRIENLQYGTYLENENDKKRHGTWDTRCALTPDKALLIREKAAAGKKRKHLAAEFEVSVVTIGRIITNKIWR